MKVNKNIKIFFNYFLGPLLFVWLCWSIYSQIKNQAGLDDSWIQIRQALLSSKITYLIGVILLMPLNWGIETFKWQLAIREIQTIPFLKAFKAVLSGVAVSLSTPNRVGEYFGRILYIDEGKRIKAVSLTIACNMSQLIVTVLMGVLGLFFLKSDSLKTGLISPLFLKASYYVAIFGLLALLLLYFRISWLVKWIDKLPTAKKFAWSIEALEHFNATVLVRFLSLSCLRFFVFIIQYYLLFRLFGVDVNLWQAWMTVSVMFLILAIIPTIALFTDLGLRSEIGIQLLGMFSANQLGVSFTSVSIWLINLVIPAIIGSLFILGIKKIFKKDEVD